MELEWCHKDKDVALNRYCLNNKTDIMNAQFSSFTTIEYIEKFIAEKNKILKAEADKAAATKKKYETFIDNTIDGSLNF